MGVRKGMAVMRHGRALAALAAGLVLLIAGCDSSTGGEATPSKEPVELFVPCEGISDDLVRQAGGDPATEESGIAGVHQTGMEICMWTAPWYFIGVFSWDLSFDKLRSDSRYAEFTDATVGDRNGLQFREVSDSRRERCDVAVSAAQGSISVNIDKMESVPNPEDPCVTATRVASLFAPQLPR